MSPITLELNKLIKRSPSVKPERDPLLNNQLKIETDHSDKKNGAVKNWPKIELDDLETK